MNEDSIPQLHPDPWIGLTRPYITAAVAALTGAGLWVQRSWLDPRDPRDATLVYSSPGPDRLRALVWDEVAGWRHGRFEGGAQGTRTRLSDVSYLGGGVLPSGAEVVSRLLGLVNEPQRQYRRVSDLRDGLDDKLSMLR